MDKVGTFSSPKATIVVLSRVSTVARSSYMKCHDQVESCCRGFCFHEALSMSNMRVLLVVVQENDLSYPKMNFTSLHVYD